MQYYGGREISREDLERALLVGMSPHERRRFEKRGLSLKRSTGNVVPDKEQVNAVVTITKSATENILKFDASDASETTAVEPTVM